LAYGAVSYGIDILRVLQTALLQEAQYFIASVKNFIVSTRCESIRLRLASDSDKLGVWPRRYAAPAVMGASNDKQVAVTNIFLERSSGNALLRTLKVAQQIYGGFG